MKNLARHKLFNLGLENLLPHAWIFSGANQTPKLQFAMDFSQWLLCSNKNDPEFQNHACGGCKSCNLFKAHTHPDFKLIAPQEDKNAILVDDVRDLVDFAVVRPQLGEYKTVLINPAEALNKQAANSLLKCLEEPEGNTIFLLLAKHTDLLLPTIISRCQILNFEPILDTNAEKEHVKQVLTDLGSLWLAKNVTTIQLVEMWIKRWPNEVLYWFEMALMDLIRFKYTQNDTLLKHGEIASDYYNAINKIIPASRLWAIFEKLRQAQCWFGKGHKPNLQLLLEDMLLE